MKTLLSASAAFAFVISTASAQFAAGNLAVLRLGDGSAALNSSSTAGFVDQFTTLGNFVNTLAIPSTAGNSPLTWSGSASSEGMLTRSTDGNLLTLGGYNTAKGLASVVASTAVAVPRAVATLDLAGTYTLATTTTTAFSANNIRSAVTDGANNFWGAGAGGTSATGINYFGTASAAASVMNVNARVANLFNNNLYYSTSSGTRGIYAFNGSPTTAATATLLVATGSSSSPYDFALSADGVVLYIADDSANATGGIQKWVWNGTAYTESYVLGTGVANVGARALAVDFSGANPLIFATTSESTNRLISITDTGLGAAATTLATAGQYQVFRGVDFTPIPEPTGLLGLGALLLVVGRKALRRPSA